MRRRILVILAIAAVLLAVIAWQSWRIENLPAQPSPASTRPATAYAGSQDCRSCHERFYQLWSTSHHGLAMQPFTLELARKQLAAPSKPIRVGKAEYQAEFDQAGGWVNEKRPDGHKRYPIVHLLGGKNVFYFLTPLERGRLQVLPVAYDIRRNEWYDTAASAMRHFTNLTDEALDWRDPLYTFNTACHSCHVSQLATNYNPAHDTYHTTWAEPGINCETCHGPSGEHVKLFQTLPKGAEIPADIKLIRTKPFTSAQHNDSCSTCHAKAAIVTNAFTPGARYFDHFDLTTLENPDFYPDGRDLGENYTLTGWRMNPCAMVGQLNCIHCHTSSGRYRFAKDRTNASCLPCHAARVQNATAHTHHKADSPGNQCIACHMPMTEFGRMLRSDHSMLPPTPAATIAHKSPNACNICHTDKDAAWSDKEVRQWHARDYQAPVLARAALIDTARKGDWSKLPEILAYVADPKHDEVFTTSLVRLLAGCNDARKWPVLIAATRDRSPLVRSAAVIGLTGNTSDVAIAAIVAAMGDEYRLVRVRAAGAWPVALQRSLPRKDMERLWGAMKELEASLKTRPDDWTSQYNLGNYYSDRGEMDAAVAAFETATRLRPDVVQPLVNVSLVYAHLGRTAQAEEALAKAIKIDPRNAAVNFNLGLLRSEQGRMKEAEQHLRAALKVDPSLAPAAYNLAVILSKDRMPEAIDWCRKAVQAQPADHRYAYTLAFFQDQSGKSAEAIETLMALIQRSPEYADGYALLAGIHEKAGHVKKAADVYRRALERANLSPQERQTLQMKLLVIEQTGGKAQP